jgi:hypothetical protein
MRTLRFSEVDVDDTDDVTASSRHDRALQHAQSVRAQRMRRQQRIITRQTRSMFATA